MPDFDRKFGRAPAKARSGPPPLSRPPHWDGPLPTGPAAVLTSEEMQKFFSTPPKPPAPPFEVYPKDAIPLADLAFEAHRLVQAELPRAFKDMKSSRNRWRTACILMAVVVNAALLYRILI